MNPTFLELVASLKSSYMERPIEVEIKRGDMTYRGKVTSLEMEDGSGKNWLVKLHAWGDLIYVRAE